MGVAFAAVRYFRVTNPIEMPVGAHIEISWPVLTFTATISVVTAVLSGLVPAWKASRLDVIEPLKESGRGSVSVASQRLIKGLIAGEIALSLVLLAGAGLLMESVLKMDSEPLGFRPEGLAVAAIRLPANRYPDAAHRLRFYERLISKLEHRSAITTDLPPYGGASSVLHIAGKPVAPELERRDVGQRTVSPGYLEVLDVRLLRGRNFDSHDRTWSEPVTLINEATAGEYFPGADPIGQRICIDQPGEKNPWRTIVGVVANEKTSRNYHQIGWIERAQVLIPLSQDPANSVSFVVRGSGSELRRALSDVDGGAAIGDIESMQGRLGKFVAYPQFRATLLSAFAVFALLLAALGLYGVLRQFVLQRTQEIGVRMAVGARPADVLRLVILQAWGPMAAGLIAGLLGSAVLGRYLASLLYGVRPGDPMTLLIVSATLVCLASLATVLPARRATRVDPMIALRNE